MSTPSDPDDDASGAAEDRNVSDEESVWQSIVANYGERVELESDDEAAVPGSPRGLSDETAGAHGRAGPMAPGGGARDPEEHFVPPSPPPLPRPEPHRLLAWLGLFGVPLLVLVLLVVGVDLPAWAGLILMVWFVGGFVYLVASMRPGPGDDYDDGAVL